MLVRGVRRLFRNRFKSRLFRNKFIYILLLGVLISFVLPAVVYASDGAYTAYRSLSITGINAPKIRYWNSTGSGNFTNETELPTAGANIRHLILKTSPISSKMVLIVSTNDSFLDGYVCYTNCLNASNWAVYNDFANATASTPQRRFDFDFESATDDIIIVYAPTTTNISNDLAYRIIDSNTLNLSESTELYINDVGQGADVTYSWVSVKRNPLNTSQEIALIGFDLTSTDINSWIWNGTTWGNELAISNASTATGNLEALAIAYSFNGSYAMAIGGDGANGNFTYARWNGSLWSTVGFLDIDASDANDIAFITLKPSPVTDGMQAVFTDNGADLATSIWNHSTLSWNLTTNIDTGLDIATARAADFSWLPNGTAGRLVWETDGGGTTLSQRLCTPQCVGTTTTHVGYLGTGSWLTLYTQRNTTDLVKFLGIRLNTLFNLGSFMFNGSNYTGYGNVTPANTTTISLYEDYSLDFIKSTFIPLVIKFVPPTDNDGDSTNKDSSFVNVTTVNMASTCILNWSGTIYNMSGDVDVRYYNVTGLASGTYNYSVTCNVSTYYKNSSFRTLTVDLQTMNVTFTSPTYDNNSIIGNLTFRANVSANKNVSFCTLNITNSTSTNFYNMTGTNNTRFIELAPFFDDTYIYNVYCEDFTGTVVYTETRNLIISIPRSEAFVAYRSSSGIGLNAPKVRLWNGSRNSSYGSEVELATAGSPIRNLVLKASPTSSKIILITSSDDTFLDSYICFYNCTIASNWVVSNNFANSSVSVQRRFDFDFESLTGDAILVYAPNTTNISRDLAYRVLDDTNGNFTDTAELYINDTGHAAAAAYTWVLLDRNPINTSEELTMLGFDLTNADINAWIWNGTAWGNDIGLSNASTATTNFEALAVRYLSGGSKVMVLGATGANGDTAYATWNGSTWPNRGQYDIDGSDVNDIRFITLKSNPADTSLQAVFIDSGSDLATALWNETTLNWTVTTNIDATVDSIVARNADFAWLPNGTSGKLVWDTDGAGLTLSERVCSPFCTGATLTVSTYTGTGTWLTLFRNRVAGSFNNFLGIRLNSTFALGSFFFNGTNYTNYANNAIATTTTVSTYESYMLGFVNSFTDGVMINFIRPTDGDGAFIVRTWSFVNVTVSPEDVSCVLDWNSVFYDMSGTGNNRYYNKTGLLNGLNTYSVTCNNSIITGTTVTRTLFANTSTQTIVGLIAPANNSFDNATSIVFTFNVTTNPLTNILNCSLIANGLTINTTTSSPVDQDTPINISGSLVSGQYNWSIFCIDENLGAAISETWNLTIRIPPSIINITLTDFSIPDDQLILSGGSTQTFYCNAIATDPFGSSNMNSASATLYYFLNLSNNSDDNNTHYTNSSCLLNETTVNNATFVCGFDVQYYANNGTWNCNITVFNNQSIPYSGNVSSIIAPLYAVNLTDGIDFGPVSANIASLNVSANITNFGNMRINVTLQGYAMTIGDSVGMNCSDGTNVSISNIRFSTNTTANFTQKIPLNGSIQQISFQLPKQFNGSVMRNSTYWQILIDPGLAYKICNGHIIFNAEAS